jgi:hypothetical protein
MDTTTNTYLHRLRHIMHRNQTSKSVVVQQPLLDWYPHSLLACDHNEHVSKNPPNPLETVREVEGNEKHLLNKRL